MHAKSSGGHVIYLSFFFSMCLTVLPWSNQVATFMPHWTLMTLMYWSIALPYKVSIGTGFMIGLLFDVLTGSLLGLNTLAFCIAAFLSHTMYSQIRNYLIWQQAGFLLFFFLSIQLLMLWITQLASSTNTDYTYWFQALTSALLWPFVFATLRLTRRRFRVQ